MRSIGRSIGRPVGGWVGGSSWWAGGRAGPGRAHRLFLFFSCVASVGWLFCVLPRHGFAPFFVSNVLQRVCVYAGFFFFSFSLSSFAGVSWIAADGGPGGGRRRAPAGTDWHEGQIYGGVWVCLRSD